MRQPLHFIVGTLFTLLLLFSGWFVLAFLVPLFRALPSWYESDSQSANAATIVSSYGNLAYTSITLVGVLAATVSLVFVVAQLNMIRVSNDATALQSMVSTMATINATSIADKRVAQMWLEGNAGLSNLDPADLRRFHLIAATETTFYQNFWRLQQEQGIGRVVWQSWEKSLLQELSTPGRRDWWEQKKIDYDEGFRNHVEAKLRKQPSSSGPLPPSQRTASAGIVGFVLGLLLGILASRKM